ncbi:hypothetical protein CK228_28630 [Mesorhizobium sp. WSM4312]|nr:hypothetical protein CK228_28630 [Mesorhizobium sp. WSM4312]
MVEAWGEWHVRVVEADKETTLTYDMESFALAYAEGQIEPRGTCADQ